MADFLFHLKSGVRHFTISETEAQDTMHYSMVSCLTHFKSSRLVPWDTWKTKVRCKTRGSLSVASTAGFSGTLYS